MLQQYDDGDKFVVLALDGVGQVHLHLIGTDDPETSRWECLAFEAGDRIRELIPVGTEIFVETGETVEDKGGRTCAYVWIQFGGYWELLNEILIREGYAGYERPAKGDDRYDHDLRAASEAAQTAKAGYRTACGGSLHNASWKYRCLPVGQPAIDYLTAQSSGGSLAGNMLRGAEAVRIPDHAFVVGADIEGPSAKGKGQIGVWVMPDSSGASGLDQIKATEGFVLNYTPSIPLVDALDPTTQRSYDQAITCVKDAL